MLAARDNPGVLAPPPLLFAGVLAAALLLDRTLLRLPTGLPGGLRAVVAALEFAGAAVLMTGAFRRFRRAGTNVEPWLPSTALVTAGVYQFSRNPIYVGMTLIYLAAALLADSLPAIVLVVPLLLVVRYGVIAREERYLDARFGQDYRCYKAAVRRWL